MRPLPEMRRVKRGTEADLLGKPGVTGVDIGCKYVGGQKTDEQAIRVYVQEKRDVPGEEAIPKRIAGVSTDVIERRFILHPERIRVQDLTPREDKETYDPLQGGISIGPCREIDGYVYVGTLGVLVMDNATGEPMLLSNFHVLGVDRQAAAGDTMAQPGLVDGGSCPEDVVGELQRMSLGRSVDCAVARQTGRGRVGDVQDIGPIAGPGVASTNMAVRKRGRTTGLTYGLIETVDLSLRIDYGDGIGNRILRNQIGINVDPARSGQFGAAGDSGSVVVNEADEVVGLHFAGSEDGSFGAANPIRAVLAALDVSLFTGETTAGRNIMFSRSRPRWRRPAGS